MLIFWSAFLPTIESLGQRVSLDTCLFYGPWKFDKIALILSFQVRKNFPKLGQMTVNEKYEKLKSHESAQEQKFERDR